MVRFDRISKQFGKQVILDEVSLHIRDGDRLGLIGPNGSGKSTIFGLLTGEVEADGGMIHRRRGLVTGYLPQEMKLDTTAKVMEHVLGGNPRILQLEERLQEITESLGSELEKELQQELVEEQAGILHELGSEGGYSAGSRARELLAGLGIPSEWFERSLSELSGGWAMRVHLARLLFLEPDMLLLDEPTNHLDIESLTWLEKFLLTTKRTVVIVSHDRRFLDNMVNTTAGIRNRSIHTVRGGYEAFEAHESERLVHETKAYDNQQRKIAELEEFITRNRARKDKAAQVQSRVKALDKIDVLDAPKTAQRSIRFSFPESKRAGKEVLGLKNISKSYGDNTVLENLDFSILRGERIAVIGANGAGKTTLLKIAAGILGADKGDKSDGYNLSTGYYAQHTSEALPEKPTVLEESIQRSRGLTLGVIRGRLGAFLFSGEDVEKSIGVLSGGERARLALMYLLFENHNFLCLDEPTNHLDIPSREMLSRALLQYGGTILFISHDRHFINRLATKVVYMKEGGKPEIFLGDYDYYEWKKAGSGSLAEGEEGKAKGRGSKDGSSTFQSDQPRRKKDLDKDRKREEAAVRQEKAKKLKRPKRKLQEVEDEIDDYEKKKASLELEMTRPEVLSDGTLVAEKSRELSSIEGRLGRLYHSWEEWSETVMKIEMKYESTQEED